MVEIDIGMNKKTSCQKLELLSRTAALKQGIDGTVNDRNSSSTFVLDSGNRVGVTDSNIPSPVSSDGEDEDLNNIVTSGDSHIDSSGENSNSLIRLSSPISTVAVEYRQSDSVDAQSCSLPSSPSSSYGRPFFQPQKHIRQQHHHHTQHQVNQQDYPASFQYHHQRHHHHNGNIIRTSSEASLAYANNSIPISSHTTKSTVTVATNINTEYDNNLNPSLPPSRVQQQQPSYEDMVRRIRNMQEQLHEKDTVVSSLQHRVNYLENQIHELRQLPTGKISHIPVNDMIRIMQEYGSETSNQTLPQQRKNSIKKASIVRQFRRWNPEFFRFFLHINGEWIPKLGRDGELRRRAEKRRLLLITKQTDRRK